MLAETISQGPWRSHMLAQKEALTNPPSAAYSNAAPMATWQAGSTHTLRWPAKNHATVPAGPGTVQVYIGTAGGGDNFNKQTPLANVDFSNQRP